MREIKFRAWDKQEKKMCGVEIINLEIGCFLVGNSPTPWQYISNSRTIVAGIEEGHFVNFENLELMQYTGFHDKNGKEIYEGDIVKTSHRDVDVIEFGNIGYDGSRNGLSGFGLRSQKTEGFYELQYYFKPYKIKIIGNIYENPEPLEKP